MEREKQRKRSAEYFEAYDRKITEYYMLRNWFYLLQVFGIFCIIMLVLLSKIMENDMFTTSGCVIFTLWDVLELTFLYKFYKFKNEM